MTISSWGPKGLGKGVIGKKTIYVPLTAPGDQIHVHITRVLQNEAYGKINEVYKLADSRETPKCAVFGRCGGCQLQHVSQSAQRDYKIDSVTRLLDAAGVTYPEIQFHPAKQTYHYRNKAQFSVDVSGGQVKIGLSAPRSQRIIATTSCEIQHPLVNEVLNRIYTYCDWYSPDGLSTLVVRVGFNTDELMVILSGSHPEPGIVDILKTIPQLKSVIYNHNPNPKWQNMGTHNEVLFGTETIDEVIEGIRVSISPGSFFQANSTQLPVLWSAVSRAVGDADEVLDLYCGSGAMSLFLAKTVRRVTGVESFAPAIDDANDNARRNNIENAMFIAGDVADVLPTLASDGATIVVDPPRKGLERVVINEIVMRAPKTIVYVSCAPETLCRDLMIFCEAGYGIESIELQDMFSQTHHAEIVVRLVK